MVTSDFRSEVEIWPYCTYAMKNMQYNSYLIIIMFYYAIMGARQNNAVEYTHARAHTHNASPKFL